MATVTVGAALLTVLLAYTLSADIEHIPVAVRDGDRSSQSQVCLERFADDEFFGLRYWPWNDDEAHRWIISQR